MPSRSYQLPPRRTGGDHQDVPVVRGWRLFSRTWNQWTCPWTKQSTWLRIIHSADWCLRLALRTHSGACQKRNKTNECNNNAAEFPRPHWGAHSPPLTPSRWRGARFQTQPLLSVLGFSARNILQNEGPSEPARPLIALSQPSFYTYRSTNDD